MSATHPSFIGESRLKKPAAVPSFLFTQAPPPPPQPQLGFIRQAAPSAPSHVRPVVPASPPPRMHAPVLPLLSTPAPPPPDVRLRSTASADSLSSPSSSSSSSSSSVQSPLPSTSASFPSFSHATGLAPASTPALSTPTKQNARKASPNTDSPQKGVIVIGSRTPTRPVSPMPIGLHSSPSSSSSSSSLSSLSPSSPPSSPSSSSSSITAPTTSPVRPPLPTMSSAPVIELPNDALERKRSLADRFMKRMSLASSTVEDRDEAAAHAAELKRLSEAKSTPDDETELLNLLTRFPLVVLEGPNQLYLSADTDTGEIGFDFSYSPTGWKLMNELWRFFWIDMTHSRSLKPFAASGKLCLIQSALTKQFLTMKQGEPRFCDIPFSEDNRSENSQAIIELFSAPESLLESGVCLFDPACFRQQDPSVDVVVVFSANQVPIGRQFLTADLTPVFRPTRDTLRLGQTEISISSSLPHLSSIYFSRSSSLTAPRPKGTRLPSPAAAAARLAKAATKSNSDKKKRNKIINGAVNHDDDDDDHDHDDDEEEDFLTPPRPRLRSERKVRADSGRITTKLAIGLAEIFCVEIHAGHPALRNVSCNTIVGLSNFWQEYSTSNTSFRPALVATGPIANHNSNYFTPCIKVALRANSLRYICAHPLGNKLLCNRKKAATWENFLIRFDLQLSCAFIWTSLERYWTCSMSSGKMTCSEKGPSQRTRFQIEWKTPGRVAILAPNGNYVRVRGSELIADRASSLDPSCIFKVVFFGDEDLVSELPASTTLRESMTESSIARSLGLAADDEDAERVHDRLSKKRFRTTIKAEISEISRLMARLRREENNATGSSPSSLTSASSSASTSSVSVPLSSSSSSSSSSASPIYSQSPSTPSKLSSRPASAPQISMSSISGPLPDAPMAPTAPELPELFGKERVIYAVPEVAHLFKDFLSVGWLLLTDFRVVYVPPRTLASGTQARRTWELPLGCIERVVQSNKIKDSEEGFYGFEFQLYNLRSIRLCATPHTFRLISFPTLRTVLEECVRPVRPEFSYTLRAGPLTSVFENLESIPSFEEDMRRLGVPNSEVRLCEANREFYLCRSYPTVIAVPAQLTDDEMVDIAQFRSKGRVPAIVWVNQHLGSMLVRCSQPRSGLRNARCEADERFIFFVRTASHKPGTIQLLDARPHLNAVANHFKGGGGENLSSGYPNCSRKYLNIGNIHKMRHSLERLRIYCEDAGLGSVDQSSELSGDSSSADVAWIENIRLILAGGLTAAEMIANGVSCVVHCSDGWDRTPQITALAQLLLDPYYRTMTGLQVLIEKEWCSFGHQFSTRTGVETRKITDSNRSPIFLQWLDCVYQLTLLFPRAFEFTSIYLKDILQHVYSSRFGTFLFDSLRERLAHQVFTKTDSLWAMLNRTRISEPTKYLNPKFEPVPGPILNLDLSLPDSVRLWADLYLDPSFPYASPLERQ